MLKHCFYADEKLFECYFESKMILQLLCKMSQLNYLVEPCQISMINWRFLIKC